MDDAADDIDFELLLTLFTDAAETIREPTAIDELTPPWAAAPSSWPGTAAGSHVLDPISDPFVDLINDLGPLGLAQGPVPPLAPTQGTPPMPNFGPSLGQAPTPAASQSGKKKRVSTAQQVQELEEQLKKQELLAKSLAMSNIWLCEKHRVIELIIQANDGQLARGRMVQRGLDFNPFVGLKTNMEAVRNATPKSLAETVIANIGSLAMQLAAVQPLLQTNPHLLTESRQSSAVPHAPALPTGDLWAGQRPQPPPAAKGLDYLPELVDHSNAHMMPQLRQLLEDVRRMCMAWSFLYLVHPKLLQANNVRLHALQGSSASWETLASTMQEQQGRSAAAVPAQGPADQLPVIAPEVQWRNTVASLKLTDRQRLRCAVLWNVIDSARKKVQQQRAQLGAAMSQLLQPPPTPPPTTDPAAAAATAAAAAVGGSRSTSGSSPKSGGSPRSVAGGGITSAGDSSSEGLGPGVPTDTATQAGGSGGSSGFARPSVNGGGGGGGGCGGCTEACVKAVVWKTPEVMQREQALLDKLQHTLIKERCLILLGAEIVFTHILTPVQDAVALVSSYPYMPDQMAIIGAAATEFQPDVLDRLVSAVAGSTTPGIHLNQLT